MFKKTGNLTHVFRRCLPAHKRYVTSLSSGFELTIHTADR